MTTKEEFETEREKLILEGNTLPNSVKALGVLEGLLEMTDPIEGSWLPSGYNPDTHEKASLMRFLKRKYGDRILSIDVDEGISEYHPPNYSARVSLMLLNEIKDPRPCGKIPTLTLAIGGMGFSYLNEKTVDDAMTLLEIYKSALQTQSYGEREKQIEPLIKTLREKRGLVIEA